MMPIHPPFNPPAAPVSSLSNLFDALDNGAMLITPNNRLSQELTRTYFAHRAQPVLEKPAIYPYKTFLTHWLKALRLDAEFRFAPLLLSSHQERELWRLILQTRELQQALVDPLHEAYARACAWDLHPTHPDFNETPQTQLFCTLWQDLNHWLEANHAMTQSTLEHYLLSTHYPLSHQSLYWICFNEFTPMMQQLQAKLTSQSIAQNVHEITPNPNTPRRYEAASEAAEDHAIAGWIKARLEQGDQKIGVVFPNIEGRSQAFLRVLKQYVDKAHVSLSLGQPLAKLPMVNHALHFLRPFEEVLSKRDILYLLRSPYLKASATEASERARLLQHKVIQRSLSIPSDRFLALAKSTAPKLYEALTLLESPPSSASAGEWVVFFKNRLNTLGFPGEYGQDSRCYQVYQRFVALLDDWQETHLICPTLSLEKALGSLKDLALQTVFQYREPNKPVRIMGLLEAQGVLFDALWVAELTQDTLPAKPELQPYLPKKLQKQFDMPKAKSEKELHLAHKILHRLRGQAPTVIFSHTNHIEDRPILPSPLITHLSLYTPCETLAEKPRLALEWCETVYQLPPSAKDILKGGTNILAYQAKCPFKNFAAHRLNIPSEHAATDGLSPPERGQALHKMLEVFWAKIASQAKLLSLDTDTLNTYKNEAVEAALLLIEEIAPSHDSSLMKDLERQRLDILLTHFIDFEKNRPAFTVEALEKQHAIEINGLPLHMRIDRIDSTPDGKKWVIDYKSSLPQSKPWQEERPEEPQLLLYALVDEAIDTLFYLKLAKGQLECFGISSTTKAIDGIRPVGDEIPWASQRALWQQRLEHLVDEIREGHIAPTPLSAKICQHCDYKRLCRHPVTTPF